METPRITIDFKANKLRMFGVNNLSQIFIIPAYERLWILLTHTSSISISTSTKFRQSITNFNGTTQEIENKQISAS